MKHSIIPYIAFLLAFILACQQKNDSLKNTKEQKIIQADSVNNVSYVETSTNISIPLKSCDTSTLVRFKEFSLLINRMIVYDKEKTEKMIFKDTAEIYIELGESLEGQLIKLESNLLENWKVEQRFETSFTIVNEGPHCDLTEWQHYYSPWKLLSKNSKNEYIAKQYKQVEREKFPNVSIQDLKKVIKEHCGEEWSILAEKASNINYYPIEYGISRFFIKITAKHKDTKEKISRLIILNFPMGC